MDEDDHEKSGVVTWVNERRGVIIGVFGLVAWFVMVWLMFGDVL